FRPVVLRSAVADFSQHGWPVTGSIDGNLSTGWGIHPQQGRQATAIYEVAADIDYKTGTRLRFTLVFNFGSAHTLGRFRVAATTHPRPLPTNAGLSGEKWQEIQGKINGALDRAVAFLMTRATSCPVYKL
ncbi:MAG: hypothetical protein AB1486_33985, partial [Planctomycetota bacterium]